MADEDDPPPKRRAVWLDDDDGHPISLREHFERLHDDLERRIDQKFVEINARLQRIDDAVIGMNATIAFAKGRDMMIGALVGVIGTGVLTIAGLLIQHLLR